MLTRLKRILLGLVVGIGVCAAGLWLLIRLLGNREPAYLDKPADYWLAQAASGNLSASNEAVTVFTTVMIPQLTKAMFDEREDSGLRLALIDELNSLFGIRIYFMPAQMRRVEAANELAKMGPVAVSAVPDLVRALKSNDEPLREAAAQALGSIHTQPETIIPLLIACLDEPSTGIQAAAAQALAQYGPRAGAAVPKLVPLLKTQDKDLRQAARIALRQIDPAAAESAGLK